MLLLGAGAVEAQSRRVEVKQAHVSFLLPAEMNEVPVRGGVDSLVRTFEGPGVRLLLDYGPYSDSFKHLPSDSVDLQIREEIIGGKSAKLVTYRRPPGTGGNASEFPYFAGVHFADLGQGTGARLTLAADARTPEAQASTVQIMRSIRFSEGP